MACPLRGLRLNVVKSTIVSNQGTEVGGIRSSGYLEIVNSTIAKNTCNLFCAAGGIEAGLASVINSTIRENRGIDGGVGGIRGAGGSEE